MPKYLFQGAYTVDGARGLLRDGGSQRRQVLDQAIRQLGGKLEAMYFAFGETDVYAIADIPDNVSTAAASLAVGASGAAHVRTTVLLTPEEIDEAAKKMAGFRPPGA